MSTPHSGEVYGRRLVPHVIDSIANRDPRRECFSIPRSSNPKDGWRAVSYGQYASAIDRLAHHVVKTSGAPHPKAFPTLAYVGENNAVYLIFVIAAVKAGYKALFVSPQNSEETQLHLFQLTDCHVIYHDAMFQRSVQAWLGKRHGMTANLLAPLDFWLADEGAVAHFPYVRTAEEAEREPFVVLHTSGSTGPPQPIVVQHGLIMLGDKLHRLPVWNGSEPAVRGLARSRRNLTPMPFFHAGGLYTFFGFHVYWEKPVAFAITDEPLTADFILQQLAHAPADVDSISLPPLVLEELSTTDRGCEALGRMKFVFFGGGNLNEAAGKRLLDRGVVLQNSFGLTEYGMLPFYWQTNPQEYQWLPIHSEVLGAEWRPVAGEDDVFELVIVRKDDPSSIQGVFYTFPTLDEWSSGDLFKKHPTLPDHWKYHGRCDDLIVLSNGERLNPTAVENALNGHPKVRSAIVVGTMRSQPAVLIEPVSHPSGTEEKEALLDEIWPLVLKANSELASHARISRQLILITNADKPFPRLANDAVHRVPSIKLYEPEVDELYRQAEAGWKDAQCSLDLGSEERLLQSVCRLFQTLTYSTIIEPDTDSLSAGIDSDQVVNACRLLRSELRDKSKRINLQSITPKIIHAKPSARRLTAELWGQHIGSVNPVTTDAEASRAMSGLVAKYTQDLPEAPLIKKPAARTSQQTVVLTGSTGRLGAYLLDMLVADPAVGKILCLNRSRDGRARQQRLDASRGLRTDLTGIDFLHADLARPDLGLGVEGYAQILADADRVVHAQWPADSNLALAAFEPHVRAVRNLADLCAGATRDVRLVLASTVRSATGWDGSDARRVPAGAYAQARRVAELVLDAAARRSGLSAAVVRFGQIAGPEDPAGLWSRDEWLPRLVASSVRSLGVLPRDLGAMSTVDWVTAEGAARLVLEAAAGQTKGVSGGCCYYYGVNPHAGHFLTLSEAIKEFYGERVRELVPWRDWVEALEESELQGGNAESNPALQLLNFYRGTPGDEMIDDARVSFTLDETLEASTSMREMRPITPELMVQWCRRWDL
ncbi:hypothetical protein MCOR02_003670 [Pyricularia oryzae]|nr:hypothetical protein MCOR02_003670 [Pyricularia oryzae]